MSNEDYSIVVRQFVEGAKLAAKTNGVTVIIDVFRASNTILALLESRARVKPVETIEEALSLEAHIRVGEQNGAKHPAFDFDNSPVEIIKNSSIFENKSVVFRSTNGTKGIVNAIGSEWIVVGALRNLNRVVEFCKTQYENGKTISFVAMGSKGKQRIEDFYCAKMMYFELISQLNLKSPQSMDNPWKRDWEEDIKTERLKNNHKQQDYLYSLKLNVSQVLPILDNESGYLVQ